MGTVPSVVFGGVGCLVVVALAARKWPEIARLGPVDKLGDKAPSEPPMTLPAAPVEVEGLT